MCNIDTDIEALAHASVIHYCLVLVVCTSSIIVFCRPNCNVCYADFSSYGGFILYKQRILQQSKVLLSNVLQLKLTVS